MSTVNITGSPYYDDFNEDKNYQRILFKPGVSVQSRELNQIQSIFHNSVSKTADGIYGEGARLTNEPVSFNILDDAHNQIIRSVKLTGTGSNVASYVGKYIVGTTSNTIGLVRFAFPKDDPDLDDPATLVIDVKSVNGYIEYNENETIRVYNSLQSAYDRNTEILATETTELNVNITATASAAETDDEITLTSKSGVIKEGDQLELPNSFRQGLVVTKVLTENSVRLNFPIGSTLSTSTNMIFRRKNTCPTSIINVSPGVYYKNGYFTKISSQSIVPSKYTAYPTKSIILTYSESLTDYTDDETLLDPAFESSNYLAPGADRLKTSLTINSVNLTSDETPDTTDDHVEVVRLVEGKVVLVENTRNNLPSYLNNILADRTYDESGNYEIKSFRLSPKGSSADDSNARFHISPGKAVVGGQTIETIGPTLLSVPKAKTYDSLEDIFVNANQDEYIVIDNPQFGYIDPGKIRLYDFLEAHSTTDRSAMSASTLVGYVIPKHMVYDSGEGASTRYRLYPGWYYQSSATLTPQNIKSLISKNNILSGLVGNDGTYNSPKFFANINATKGLIDNKMVGFDMGPRKRLIFPIDNKFLKSVSNLRVYYSKKIENQTVTGSVVTVSLSGTETFIGNAGVVSTDTKRRYYQALARSVSSGTIAAGQPIDIDNLTFTLDSNRTTLTINLGSTLVTGAIDLYVTVYNSELSRKTKLLNTNYVSEPINITTTDFPYSTYRSDIYALKGIYSIGSNTFLREYASGTAYVTNDHVSKDGIIYRAVTNSTGQSVTNQTYWKEIPKENAPLYSFDNGAKDLFYDHAYISYKGNLSVRNPGNVVVVLDYFSHSGTGVIDFNSYPASVQNNIPLYRSEDGTTFNLRQALDFRPKKNDTNVAANFWHDNNSNTHFAPNPILDNSIQIDYDYYQGRVDRLYLLNRDAGGSKAGFNFYLDKGVPDLYPKTPKDISSKDKLLIGTLAVPPFTQNAADVKIFYNKAPRYTMADIQTIDQRLTSLEKRVKKQGLDIIALNNQVFDGGNIANLYFKTGILVDDFSSVGPNDIKNPHSTCVVANKELNPSISATSFNLFFESEPDLNVENDLVTFNVVSEEPLISVVKPTFVKNTTGTTTTVGVSVVNPNPAGVKSSGSGNLSTPELALLGAAGAYFAPQIGSAAVIAGGQVYSAVETVSAIAQAPGAFAEELITGGEQSGSVLGSVGLSTDALISAAASTAAGINLAATAGLFETATGASFFTGEAVGLGAAAAETGFIATAIEFIGGILGFFSDNRLKQNIEKLYTHSSGINIYRYEKFGKQEIGVLAQELLVSHPYLVNKNDSGHYMVNYNKLSKILLDQ